MVNRKSCSEEQISKLTARQWTQEELLNKLRVENQKVIKEEAWMFRNGKKE